MSETNANVVPGKSGASMGTHQTTPPQSGNPTLGENPLPAWLLNAAAQVSHLPSTLGELSGRSNTANVREYPFALVENLGEHTLYVPSSLPNELANLAASVVKLAKIAFPDVTFAVSPVALDAAATETLSQCSDQIIAAAFALGRDKITYITGLKLSKDKLLGFNFATKVAFFKAAGSSQIRGEYRFSTHEPSLLAGKSSAWSATSVETVSALNRLVSLAAAASAVKVDLSSFIRSKEELMIARIGKKPYAGLYNDSEFSRIMKDHERRTTEFEALYSAIPKTVSGLTALQCVDLPEYLDKLCVRPAEDVTRIEATVVDRKRLLLVSIGTGRKQVISLAKGSSLSEKINDANLLDTRQVARVLASPISASLSVENIQALLNVAAGRARDDIAIDIIARDLLVTASAAPYNLSAGPATYVVEAARDLVARRRAELANARIPNFHL